MGAHLKVVRDMMKGALRIVYPPQCLACGETVGHDGALCPNCWRETDFIGDSACRSCGVPLPGDGTNALDDLVCDDCLHLARPWQDAKAAVTYRGAGRQLALMLKHGDRLDIAAALGGWVAEAATPLIRADAIVAPIPLHFRRLLRRRYNQAELLAREVARRHDLLHLPDLLQRRRATPPQDHRSLDDRFSNVAEAFVLHPRHATQINDRPVILVDDVMASGATMTAAAQVLLAAGAGPISVVVLARAVKET